MKVAANEDAILRTMPSNESCCRTPGRGDGAAPEESRNDLVTIAEMDEHGESPLDGIRYLHTLGPRGTNLEAAAHEWLRRRRVDGSVELHASLETALDTVPHDGRHALVACAVYPALHTLTFANLHRVRMVDCFLMPTHNMVLATVTGEAPRTVSSHAAPAGLVSTDAQTRVVLSNSQAAIDCATGITEGCITTSVAAERHGLRVVRDFGPVPMVFTIHQVHGAAAPASDAPLSGAAL